MALVVIGLCRWQIDAENFERWGWRLPFLISIVLLILSVYIRVSLRETPVFLRMKAEGRSSKQPVTESFFRYPNNKIVLLALLGATAGQGVVWYTGQFYVLFFLTIVLGLNYLTTYVIVGAMLIAGMPLFIFFGWLSDKIGRLKIIMAGCLLAALTYIPLFQILAQGINPALVEFQKTSPITLRVDEKTCNFHIFIGPWSNFTICDQVTDYLTKSGVSFKKRNAPDFQGVIVTMGSQTVEITASDKQATNLALQKALFGAGYPGLSWKYVNGEPQTDKRGNPVFEFTGADVWSNITP